MKLIDNWRQAWRMLSMIFSALAVAWLALPADAQAEHGGAVVHGCAEPVDAGHGRDDDHVPPLEQRVGGDVTEPVEMMAEVVRRAVDDAGAGSPLLPRVTGLRVMRVTEWRSGPGDNTGWHRHGMDYVVVPLMAGKVRVNLPGNEETMAEMKKGVPYFRETGVEHDVINANDGEYAFIEVELK